MVMLGEREMHGNRLRADAHFQQHLLAPVMVLQQQGELLEIIVAKQVGAGQGGSNTPGPATKP
jgi:hypothetical protein